MPKVTITIEVKEASEANFVLGEVYRLIDQMKDEGTLEGLIKADGEIEEDLI